MSGPVGRLDELHALKEFLDSAAAPAAALVIEGDAGIGKTTLWRAALELAAERPLRVLRARPVQAERHLTNAGLGDLIGDILDEALGSLPAARRHALEVALLRARTDGSAPDAHAVGLAVMDVLQTLSERDPLVIAVDDEQWLDASSAAVLEFALRRSLEHPIRLLVARRSGERGPRLERALPTERSTSLVIRPLSLGATHALIRERLGHSFPRPRLLRIYDTSAGNPFFALELARAFEGDARELRVPETLDTAVQNRLRRLPKRVRGPLLAASTTAGPTVALLEHGWPEAAEALDLAERAGVIEQDEGEVRFVHPLFASVLYERSTASARREVHGRLAELVSDPVERARHLALARPGPDPETADALEAAAEHARGRGAPADAAELGELSISRTPAEAVQHRRRRKVRVLRDHLASGDSGRARALADELVQEAMPGRERAEALMLHAEIEDRAGERQASIDRLQSVLAECDEIPDLRVRACAQLAVGLTWTEGVTAAIPLAESAVEIAATLDDPVLESLALSALAQVRFLGGVAGASELAERACAVARAARNPAAVETTRHILATIWLWFGQTARARELLSADLDEAAGRDEGRELASCWVLSLVEWRAGNWQQARELAEHGRELALMLDDGNIYEAHFPLATVAAHLGDEAEAIALSDFARRELEARGKDIQAAGHVGIVGQVELWSGNAAAAIGRFENAAHRRDLAGFREPAGPRRYDADHIEALLELGRIDEAEAVLEPWAADAERLDREWALASVARCRGLIAVSRGELRTARLLLEDAVARHEAVGDPFGRGRALLALGRVLRRLGERRHARETLHQALDGFETLGAARWVARTRAELARIGGRVRENGLTPAELRVAELVAHGRTNREVAAALYLSEKTVESHLSHIYAKLNLRSRTELARELARAG